MQLNNISIETRIRNGWSSIDLGMKLALNCWLKLSSVWLLFALPVYIIACVFLQQKAWLIFFIIWWLKPLFERPILHILSRELFADKLSVKRVFKEFWLWFKPGWLSAITYRRLNFSRSFYMPVVLLEGLQGAAYNKRIDVLNAKFSSEAFWLTLLLVHIESILGFALLILAAILFPEQIQFFETLTNEEQSSPFITYTVSLLVMASVAPFYVASGFMLYISRRIELEGWDIEICFRDWVTKYENKSQ